MSHPYRSMISVFAGIAASAFLMAAGLAATADPIKGNEGKGRYYFRQTCKDCHTKGAKGGEVTPLTKTMAQWRTYFITGKHALAADALAQVMPSEHLIDVQTFLVK